MPVKRRSPKRRIDPAAEYEVWESIFSAGIDFFGGLPDIGVASDAYGRPDADAAAAAWARHGSRYLVDHGGERPIGRPAWALEQFGEPYAG
jgi:hypothetical protein